ncbi:PspC domain-containing protein [Arachidicoccus sp.]|uniref:PspC domain-containing protein n=1 Tax=Arachidicoccus sp. TaxID=1872624 RepID=UPI003D1CA6CF
MKKVININFQGRVVMIEETAYENLKSYIESLRTHFADEEGCDEIINDIESRISELFGEIIKKGNPCVSESDLDAIISSIGRPEDFEEEENSLGGKETKTQSQNNQASAQNAQGHKQLFRDETNKKIGGVCAGIANYFNIDPTMVRLITLVLFFTYGIGIIPYIILWIAVPSSATQVIGSSQKKLFRDISNKTIGGVCSGLASYFNVSIWIPKVIFIIGVFCTLPISLAFNLHSGGFFFPGINGFFITLYIILWIVVPPAVTASNKLSMKGENVDLNNIKSTVQEDLGDGKKKVTSSSPNEPVQTLAHTAPSHRSTLGDFIILLCKIFAYFIVGIILISIIGGLGVAGVALIGISPLKDYIIGGLWENIFTYVAFLLLIWVPVIGIIVWIIRKLTKSTRSSKALRITFISLWFVGLIAGICLIASIYNDFKYVNDPTEMPVTLNNAKINKLEITLNKRERPYYNRHWFFNRDMDSFFNDSTFINNTNVRIIPASADSFGVSIAKFSNGKSMEQANILADKINFTAITQRDSILDIPTYFSINKTDKFRNQFVIITVAVPLGKRIEINKTDGFNNRFLLGFDNDDFDFYYDNGKYDWDYNTEYLMTKDGLIPTHTDIDISNDKIKSAQDIIKEQQEKIKEQQDDIKEKIEKQKEDLNEQQEKIKNNLQKVQDKMNAQIQNSTTLNQDAASISTGFENPVLMIGKAFAKII